MNDAELARIMEHVIKAKNGDKNALISLALVDADKMIHEIERLQNEMRKAASYLQMFYNGAERAAHDVLVDALGEGKR